VVVVDQPVDQGRCPERLLRELEPCGRECECEGREEDVVSEVAVDTGLTSMDVLLLELEPC
jgi:hypothetical protein